MVNKFLYPRGGAETYVLSLGDKLREMGHEIEYFGMYDEQNTVGNSAGQYTKNVDFHKKSAESLLYPFSIVYSFDARKKIGKVIENFRPDIIHLNNINFQITPAILDTISKYGIPVIMTAHDFQLICPNHLLYQPDTFAMCKKCTSKLSVECLKHKCIHGSLFKSAIGLAEAAVYRNRKTYKKIDRIVCPSLFMKDMLDKQEIFKGKTVFVRNFSADVPDLPKAEKENYILYFGRLYREKGIHNLVEAMKELPDIKLVVAGGGPLESLLEGVENIEFVGFKTGQELQDLVRKALFTVYPSVWYENCPLSIIESQKLGTPCLMTGIGGMKELAGKGMTIPGTTKEDVKNAIRELYDSKETLQAMEEELKELVPNYPNLETYAGRLEDIYVRTQDYRRNPGI